MADVFACPQSGYETDLRQRADVVRQRVLATRERHLAGLSDEMRRRALAGNPELTRDGDYARFSGANFTPDEFAHLQMLDRLDDRMADLGTAGGRGGGVSEVERTCALKGGIGPGTDVTSAEYRNAVLTTPSFVTGVIVNAVLEGMPTGTGSSAATRPAPRRGPVSPVQECPEEALGGARATVAPARLLPKGAAGVREPGVEAETPTLAAQIAAATSQTAKSGFALNTRSGSVMVPDLPEQVAQSFNPGAQGVAIPAGTKLYRVIGNDPHAEVGSYWTRTPPPATEAEWRSQNAVRGEWSGDGGYVTYTAPSDLPAWEGTVAPQTSSDRVGILRGGGNQIWVPRGSLVPPVPATNTPWNTH